MGFVIQIPTNNRLYSESDLSEMHPDYVQISAFQHLRITTSQKCLNCYNASVKSKNNFDFMILVPHKTKYNPSFKDEDYLNLGAIKDYASIGEEDIECLDITDGTIMDFKNWRLMFNDFCILGAIDGKKDFILVLNSEKDLFQKELIWSKNTNKKPNTLGRELLMLFLAGYKIAPKSSSREIHFLPPSEDKKFDLEFFNLIFNEISKDEENFFNQIRHLLGEASYFTN